jgi:hypothetical protein
MGTGGPFSGVKRGWGVTLTTHPHLVPWSWMSRSYTSSPLSASMACNGTALLYFYIPEDNSELHTRRRENLKSHIHTVIIHFSFLLCKPLGFPHFLPNVGLYKFHDSITVKCFLYCLSHSCSASFRDVLISDVILSVLMFDCPGCCDRYAPQHELQSMAIWGAPSFEFSAHS